MAFLAVGEMQWEVLGVHLWAGRDSFSQVILAIPKNLKKKSHRKEKEKKHCSRKKLRKETDQEVRIRRVV